MICFLALVLYRVLRERLRVSQHPLSPRRALALLRQIQRHRVEIQHQPVTGTSRITPEQSDLFKSLKLPNPDTSTTM